MSEITLVWFGSVVCSQLLLYDATRTRILGVREDDAAVLCTNFKDDFSLLADDWIHHRELLNLIEPLTWIFCCLLLGRRRRCLLRTDVAEIAGAILLIGGNRWNYF